jgi:transposase-like protein
MTTQTLRQWAKEEFGESHLGDVRRTARAVQMVARLAQGPGGTISSVFVHDAERQGAYDFVETAHVEPQALMASMAAATVRRAQRHARVYAVVDGSSLTLTDTEQTKGFGSIGALKRGARGLKVISVLAVSPQGLPLGLSGAGLVGAHGRPTGHAQAVEETSAAPVRRPEGDKALVDGHRREPSGI